MIKTIIKKNICEKCNKRTLAIVNFSVKSSELTHIKNFNKMMKMNISSGSYKAGTLRRKAKAKKLFAKLHRFRCKVDIKPNEKIKDFCSIVDNLKSNDVVWYDDLLCRILLCLSDDMESFINTEGIKTSYPFLKI